MNSKSSSRLVQIFIALFAGVLAASAEPAARITVDASGPGKPISPLLCGIFFEEINRAGDGGIYGEMLENRSFEDADGMGFKDNAYPIGWSLLKDGDAEGAMALDKSLPLNPNNPTSLRLTVTKGGGRVAIVNNGFRGIPMRRETRHDSARQENWRKRFDDAANGGLAIQSGNKYDLTFYARAGGGVDSLTVSLENKEGRVLASEVISGLGADWKPYRAAFTASATDPNAQLVLAAGEPGTVWLDMVSLFPHDTWKGRTNGLRADLMDMIAEMHPKFVRFPGGCYVEGEEIGDRFRWKNTIGDVAQRIGNYDLWGYYSSDGLGFHEYLQMCEDLGAEPLFVINCGMSHHNGRNNAFAVSPEETGEYVQDALDAIEYCNGPVTSKWGALRAANGHPAPFNLKFMEIGNENGGRDYNRHYEMFYQAIKAVDPKMTLIANDWQQPLPGKFDMMDSHSYANPAAFLRMATRYDKYDRARPKVYFGEYAVTSDCGKGNVQAAVAEAATMTGFERNADAVTMVSYAPLLSNEPWKAWNPNAIVFDQARHYGTPSYWVQTLFAKNSTDRVFPVEIEQTNKVEDLHGMIGLGTWSTQAEYKDIKVVKDGQVLFQSDFSNGRNGWNIIAGQWEVVDGALRQTGNGTGARAFIGDPAWSNYTLTLKARKLGGAEGFMVFFGSPSDAGRFDWNLGGWGNSTHGLEMPASNAEQLGSGRIETNRWYDIRIELHGAVAKCYLDDKFVQSGSASVPMQLYAVAGRDDHSGDTILKVVNSTAHPVDATINLNGLKSIASMGDAIVLGSANPLDENSFGNPMKITPKHSPLSGVAASFEHAFPGESVTILRLPSK